MLKLYFDYLGLFNHIIQVINILLIRKNISFLDNLNLTGLVVIFFFFTSVQNESILSLFQFFLIILHFHCVIHVI